MDCNCPKKNCIRHGKCEECKQYHKETKQEPYCIRRKNKKLKLFIIPIGIIISLSLIIVIAVNSTKRIVDNRYRFVQEMHINEIDLSKTEDGEHKGNFLYGKNIYTVNVTIKNNKIDNIEIEVKTKDSNFKYVEKAKPLIGEIINRQSLKIDCISGATRSSKSILKAVENALK